MSGQQRYSAPNCDVADLEPGDLIAWEGRAIRVVNVYPVEPVDWHADEKPGEHGTDERPPCRIHLDDGSRKGFHLRIGFRPRRQRTVERLKPHHQACADCGLLWPCPDELIDRQVRQAARDLERLCQHCGKGDGGMDMFGGPNLDVPGQMGAWFHSRTKRRAKCADAGERYRQRQHEAWALEATEQAEGGAR